VGQTEVSAKMIDYKYGKPIRVHPDFAEFLDGFSLEVSKELGIDKRLGTFVTTKKLVDLLKQKKTRFLL
jgi:hypothetical protein